MCIVEIKRLGQMLFDIQRSDYRELAPKGGYIVWSGIDPHGHMNRLLGSINFNLHSNFYVFGICHMQLVEEIYRRMSAYSKLILVEFFDGEGFSFEDQNNSLMGIIGDRRVTLAVGNESEINAMIEKDQHDVYTIFNMMNTRIITMPYLKSNYPREMKRILDGLIDISYSNVAGYGNATLDILWGIDNYINNWEEFLGGINVGKFSDSYSDIPIVIVGAGPSLEKNIDLLKEVREYAWILAVDTAYEPLLKRGIIPDAVSTIERTDDTLRFYKNIAETGDTVFIGPNVVQNFILKKFGRRIFTGRTGDVFFREFGTAIGDHSLNVGNNVAHVPFAFAKHLRSGQVIFTGLDLAYSGDTTHLKEVADTFDDEVRHYYDSYTYYVDGQNGEKLLTYEFFMYAKLWFEKEIFWSSGMEFINSTEGGALIAGCKNAPLRDVLQEWRGKGSKLRMRLFEAYDSIAHDSHIDKRDITEKGIEFLASLRADFKGLHTFLEGAVQSFNDEMSGRIEKIVNNRVEIEKQYIMNPTLGFIIQPIIVAYFRKLHSYPIILDWENEVEICGLSLEFYNTLKDVCAKVDESLSIYLNILETYLEKKSESANA